MRRPDHFDQGDERPKLRECDQCVGTVREDQPNEFRRCAECQEVTCPEHSHGFRADCCLRCGAERDERQCADCERYDVPTMRFDFGGRDEPPYSEMLCAACAGWPKWQKALREIFEPDPDRERDDFFADARW